MIFFVEDDSSIRELVIYTLQSSGYEAMGFAAASELDRALQEKTPELFLLDVMLPGEDGISILKRLRSQPATKQIPVIMLTAKSSEYDKVIGLDSGADDYITKPFGMMELLARIRAVLRRKPENSGKPETGGELSAGRVCIYSGSRVVTVAGEEVALTYKEFELLQCLFSAKGRVLTRDQLLETVWGYDFAGETRTVDVHIRSIRQKLGVGGDVIETVRGVGYKIGAF